MNDLNKIIGGLASSGAVSGFAGGLAGGALGSALTSKKGRKVAGSALKYGAVAAVGGLAYSAYRRYTQGAQEGGSAKPAWQGISEQRFEKAIADDGSSNGLLLVRAMIAAGYADGHLDDDERNRIFAEVTRMKLSTEDKALLFDELKHPVGIADLVRQTSSPELAAEVYAASAIAIDGTSVDGQLYLRSLAVALNLPQELVNSLNEHAGLAESQGRAA